MSECEQAVKSLVMAWPHIVTEARLVLGSELHYQAMVYHCLRLHGRVPINQIGMNVKMWIDAPVSDLFQKLDLRKHENFRGGFEPIPDVCLFSSDIASDWRRRNYQRTMSSLLLTIEVKASERKGSRLQSGEIINDIEKLAALLKETKVRSTSFIPVMMIIDTAPELLERMTPAGLVKAQLRAQDLSVELMYISQSECINSLENVYSIHEPLSLS
jgi:hypothetical protein